MKFLRRIIGALIFVLDLLGYGATGHAQNMTHPLNYIVKDTNDCYSPLFGSSILDPDQFLDAFDRIDHNDGTADSILVGFEFVYNGDTCNSVNINVNGWVSVNPIGYVNPIPTMPQASSSLFLATLPNNSLAPYWGDHFYRTLEPGYAPSQISNETFYNPSISSDTNSAPFTRLGIFEVEWRNLNINDTSDPNSVASFQLIIRQNPKAKDMTAPDERAIIEFRYGPADSLAKVAGATAGIEDSTGFSHLNGLFESSEFNGDSSKFSTTKTSCWPPPNCTKSSCTAIEFLPKSEFAGVEDKPPTTYFSLQCYPNPITNSANISVTSPSNRPTAITIFNLLGSEVARIYNGELSAGEHSFTWDSRGTLPGVYECFVRCGESEQEIPIMVAR